jgi:DNA polymerase-3 subunit delta'
MNFDGIIGQKEIVSNLKRAIESQKIGHAYIFSGPRGIGKRTAARVMSGILLCNNRRNSESCGICNSCRMYEAGSNPDFYEIDAEGSTIGVDEIRKLQGDIAIKPLYSSRKVYLIADADRMTVQAQNCLLKTLEEPPEFAVIILTTSNHDALLETVRSRAVRYGFKRCTRREISDFLADRFGSEAEGIEFAASYADGVVGTALELAGSREFVQLREDTIEMLVNIRRAGLIDVFKTYDFFEENRNSIDIIFDIMISFYRDMLAVKRLQGENVLINSDKKDIIINNARGFTVRKLAKSLEVIEFTRINIKRNINFQLSIEIMLMELQEDCN